MIYKDADGAEVEAFEITAPTILNTVSGECCAEAGQWLVQHAGCKPTLLSPDEFHSLFTLVLA